MMIRRLFCTHDWKVMVNERTRSQLEVMKSNGFNPIKVNGFATEEENIAILACSKCGKLNKTVVSNI